MEKTVNYLAAHPVLFVIAVILALMILFSFLKRVVRLFLVIAAILVLYAAWIHLTGGNMHEAFLHIEHAFNNAIRFLGDLFNLLIELLKFPKKGALQGLLIMYSNLVQGYSMLEKSVDMTKFLFTY
jgi:hypothetical protein